MKLIECKECEVGFVIRHKGQSFCSNKCSAMFRGKRMVGTKQSESIRIRMSLARKGEKHWNWQGGKNKDEEHKRERHRNWRERNSYVLEDSRERTKQWKKDNPDRVYFQVRRRKVRKQGALGTHTLEQWKELKERHDHTCLRCESSEPNIVLTEDHIIPISRGGSDYIINIQPLCRSCNAKKGVKIEAYA